MTTTTPTTVPPFDVAKAEAFAGQLLGTFTAAITTYMIDLGRRTGLFEAAGPGPVTSGELAERAGLQERYVREWLGAVTSAGIATYDPDTATYTFPVEHLACLTGDDENNLAPMSAACTHLAHFVGPVGDAFRDGGGVPYEQYRPEFTDVMDGMSRPLMDGVLVDKIVPLAGDLIEHLTNGTRVADIGCGTGHTTNLLAQAFPASTFVGYDLATDALERGTHEASDWGLTNVAFQQLDVAHLPPEPTLGAAFAFDAIHDQADPAGVLARISDALAPGGIFVMFDIRASSHLERNLENPLAPLLYGVSTLHCMTVSLACGGAGLGTVWGEELAREMLADAGFVDVEVHEAPGDPMDSVYVARKPA
jgi:SAM-dependent methyltransferase